VLCEREVREVREDVQSIMEIVGYQNGMGQGSTQFRSRNRGDLEKILARNDVLNRWLAGGYLGLRRSQHLLLDLLFSWS
jgi:hypothetical protein